MMKRFVFLALVCVTLIVNTVFAVGNSKQPKLKLVSVVFRHGDRAPDPNEMFPNDPYYNNSFYPEGLGGLTNDGKLREYNLGKLLRNKYNDFLGEVYIPSSVVARSTDYKRTKMCLQLLLSALYPPKGKQLWNRQLAWQPIPMTYVSPAKDWLMIPEECPEYLAERRKVERMPEVIEKIEKFRPFMNNLTELTGKNISSTNDMYNLYHILMAEWSMNLELPEWAIEIFPNGKLLDGINLEYEIFSYTKTMRRLNGGKLLYDILQDIEIIKSGSSSENRKIILYSGHETNVAALLQTLGVYKPHVPEYTSAVIVELYDIDNEYHVKVLYYLGIPAALVAQRIPGCDILCPLDKFVNLLSDVTPSASELLCDKTKHDEKLNFESTDNEITLNKSAR